MLISDFILLNRRRGASVTVWILFSSFYDVISSYLTGHLTEYMGSPQEDPVSRENFSHITLYQPTRDRPFRRLLNTLSLSLKSGGFVDFGAGKGRALRIARECGFSKVLGLEFSKHLIQSNPDIIHQDMSSYTPDIKEKVFYFYDPAGERPLLSCFQNIARSIQENPREALVIYHNNLLKDFPKEWHESLARPTMQKWIYWGNQFFIFKY